MRNPQDPQSPQLPLYKEILRILSKLRKIERKYKCICDFLSCSNFGAAKVVFDERRVKYSFAFPSEPMSLRTPRTVRRCPIALGVCPNLVRS